MSKQYKTDYIALQNLWFICSQSYIKAYLDGEMERCILIVDAFRDTLVDIVPSNPDDEKDISRKAIRSNYEKWEDEYWIPFCKTKLAEWIKYNTFESTVQENKQTEYQNIKQDYNYMRYRKIMQLIQDSGIGLGQGTSGGGAFDVGPKDVRKFTG